MMKTLTVIGICAFVALTGCSSSPKPEDQIRNAIPELSTADDAHIDGIMSAGCDLMRVTSYQSFKLYLMDKYGYDLTQATVFADWSAKAYCPSESQ